VLLEWPLVGRADELQLVERAMERTDSLGVVLAGPAGVGKSRLAAELMARARAAGRATAWVQATRSAGSIPFGAFAHLLPADLSAAGPVNLLRVAGESIGTHAADRPLVLGVDDAHVLDAASAALVRHLTETGTCFLVVTVRSNEPAPDAVVSLWKDGPVDRIELRSLSEEELAELVVAGLQAHVDGATLHRLWEASRGNVLYLRELVLGGVAAGTLAQERGVWRWRGPLVTTALLTELVDSRLGELTPAQRGVLEIVAHAEPIEEAFLDRLTESAEREAVERRGLLETLSRERRRQVVLSHPLYAEAVRATTPPSTVKLIWSRLADLLQASGARRSGDLLRLATWRLGAGELADSQLFVAAARRAIALEDFVLAEQLAQPAFHEGDDGFDARLVLADAALGLGRAEEADQLFAELQAGAASDEQRARAALRRSDVLYFVLGRSDVATAVLDRAAETVSDERWRGPILAAAARLKLFSGSTEEAVRTVVGLLDRPHLDGGLLTEVSPVAAWGQIVTGRTRAALEFCDRLQRVAESRPEGQYGAFAPDLLWHNRCAAALVSGELATAATWAREAYHASTTSGAEASRGVLGFTDGWVARVIGRPRSAAAVLEEAAIVLREVDFYRHRSACLGELAHSHALLGDVAAAEAALAEADAASVPSFVMDHSFIELARAWTAHARGEFSRARRIAAECARRCASFGQVAFEAFAWHDAARLGEPSSAVAPLVSLASRVDGDLVPAFAANAGALAAEDPAELGRVAATFEELGAVLYAAEALAASARLYRAGGRTGSALTAAVRAERLVEQCEGARTPALTGFDASVPLTRRELEIATLAARGLTNRQIAERLVVSVRTVDNHLHNAFAKLGIAHRDELAPIVLGGRDHGR
jgi:DNA-binding CsgD family transcriptional regulator